MAHAMTGLDKRQKGVILDMRAERLWESLRWFLPTLPEGEVRVTRDPVDIAIGPDGCPRATVTFLIIPKGEADQ